MVGKIDDKLEYMKTTLSVYIDYLKPKLVTFIEHNFVVRWQDIQFKNLLKNISCKMLFLLLILLKTMGLKCRMKFSQCIGTPHM